MANDTVKRLLARVRQLREARGLTQETFAERAGLTYKHYQQVEAGRKYDIRLSTLIKMADGLELELKELLDFDAPPMVLAEDPAETDSPTAASTGARKPPKRRSGEKGG
ncbi:MAG: helix-turn-helix transcriptional regulator [Opitutaceae bacterium]|nr:helix-turn-helix transcriptional regulator [Opitutaceae bacterium]